MVNITSEIVCNGTKYCLRTGDEVHCHNEVFEIPESPLDYHDTMFWVYLGVYVGLVLFAGELLFSLITPCSCLLTFEYIPHVSQLNI